MEMTALDGTKLASAAVQVAQAVHGIWLNYSVDSLAELDIVVGSMASAGGDSDSVSRTLFVFGCYLGEVLVHNAGGEWLATAGTPMEGNTPYPLVVRMKDSGAVCNPIGKAFKRFENGPEDGLPAFYEAVVAYRG